MAKTSVLVTKASGEVVPFSEDKLRASLERSGATEKQVNEVVGEVSEVLYQGMETGKIYKKAHHLLRKKSHSNAARYKLKKAIMELGPSGYPFEKFVGAILEQQGYATKVGVMLPGRCVQHEVDVLAQKNSKIILAECKFHNKPGVKCDVKVPLYIHSRFRDVKNGRTKYGDTEIQEFEGWIVTNTRFTVDALKYGQCSGLMMLGWDQPAKDSLKVRIGRAGLHPVTCLSTLQKKAKAHLLKNGIVLCRDILADKSSLYQLGLSDRRVTKVLSECNDLVKNLDVPLD